MYIDPHIHVVSRTTDDYEAMRKAGIVAIIEPAFWLGQPRTEVGSFKDYFSTLVGWERFRASPIRDCPLLYHGIEFEGSKQYPLS